MAGKEGGPGFESVGGGGALGRDLDEEAASDEEEKREGLVEQRMGDGEEDARDEEEDHGPLSIEQLGRPCGHGGRQQQQREKGRGKNCRQLTRRETRKFVKGHYVPHGLIYDMSYETVKGCKERDDSAVDENPNRVCRCSNRYLQDSMSVD